VPHLETAARYRKYPEAWQLLAYALEKSGKRESAAAVLDGGLAVFKDNAGLREMRPQLPPSARAWLPPLLEEPEPDVGRLRAKLTAEPENEDALFLLSRICSERGDQFFQQLQAIAPGSFRTWQVKGLQAEYAGDYATAEECYRKVVAQQPELPGAHCALGLVLRKVGKEDEGLAEIGRELKINPDHYLAYYEMGAARLKRGEIEAALPLLERAAKLRPDFVEAKVELAKTYLELRRAREAIPLLREAIERQPRHQTAHYLLYRAYTATGAPEQARAQLAIHQKLLAEDRPKSGMEPTPTEPK
jgi:tetratricopeptide (TPR) repeat protein